jgi:hypothetical protein
MLRTTLLAITLICCSIANAQEIANAKDFETDADGVYQRLKQRAQKNGFRKFIIFNQGTPAFNADPNTDYRIVFMFDVRRSDTLRASLVIKDSGQEKVIVPFQVTDGPREGVAKSTILYYTTPNYNGTIPVKLDVFPMGIVYVYKRKK